MGTYEQYRDQLRSGDLILMREHTLMAKIIRAVTRSDYCHAAVVWRTGPRIMILEARWGRGVTTRLLSEALPADWIPTGCNWTDDVETSALMRLQTRYSVWAAIALALGLAPPGQAEVCSLCAASIIQPGLPGVDIDRRGLTPGLLGEIFMTAGQPNRTLN